MSNISKIEQMCRNKIAELSLGSEYTKRLEQEIGDLQNWEKHKKEDKASSIVKLLETVKEPIASNKSHSVILFLCGISSIDPIARGLSRKESLILKGDPPDIDIDFHPEIRDRLKERISEVFGKEKTCSIGTYSTYKTRAAIVDIARVLGLDVAEIQSITKNMEPNRGFDMHDDGEETIVDKMDTDDLCEIYPELGKYFEEHPEVRRHFEVIRNQISNMGKHAGGMLISGLDLTNTIPVQYDKSDNIISSWCESGSTAELSSVGLVKADLLSIFHLKIIADCIDLIKRHHGIEIKRRDIPTNDRLSISMEARTDLKGIFQFENPGTMKIVKDVQMDSLADVAAITSLLRPGPKDMGMHEEYARRKREKKYDAPEIVKDILKETRGVMVFQEDTMRLAAKLAGFSPIETNQLRKGMGKKKKDVIDKMKKRFMEGAKENIDKGLIKQTEIEQLWNQMEAFAAYGFNKSIYENTEVFLLVDGITHTKKIKDFEAGDVVICKAKDGVKQTKVKALHDHGILPCFKVLFDNGKYEVCSANHKFLTPDGMQPLYQLKKGSKVVAVGDFGKEYNLTVEDIDFHGYEKTYDLEVEDDCHNFVLASDAVTSNSHAVAYSKLTTTEIWLKHNYFREYMIALMINTGISESRHGIENVLVDYIKYARRKGVVVRKPNINSPYPDFHANENGEIVYGLNHIRQVSNSADKIVAIAKEKPFESMADFYDRCVFESEVKTGKNKGAVKKTKPTKAVVENLIYAGAFDAFGDRRKMLQEYYEARGKKESPPDPTDEEFYILEKEVIGLELSRPLLLDQYKNVIREKGWKTIGALGSSRNVTVFARVKNIREKISKAGNRMFIVDLDDGLNDMTILVFAGGMDYFRDNLKEGSIAGIPISKFDDGDTRFFDSRDSKEIEVIV